MITTPALLTRARSRAILAPAAHRVGHAAQFDELQDASTIYERT